MPERTIDTGYWNDPFVQPKSFNAKALYIYSWTNQHCNQAGMYEITMVTITRETGLEAEAATQAFRELYPKVVWYPDKNILWVRPFIKRQSRSPKFLIAAGKSLESIPDKALIAEYLRYYQETYNFEIPYRYPIDTLSIPPARAADQDTGSGSGAGSDKEDKRGFGGEKKPDPEQEPEDPELAAIVKLYEQNIGIQTPMIYEELKDIRDHYPPGWFQAALKEALDHEARSLAYVKSILQRWEHDGFQSKKKEPPKPGKGSKRKLSEGID